jgi:hypothetical protein
MLCLKQTPRRGWENRTASKSKGSSTTDKVYFVGVKL